MSWLMNTAFALVVGVVLTVGVAIRPGRTTPLRWKALTVWFAVGIIVALVFLSSDRLYAG